MGYYIQKKIITVLTVYKTNDKHQFILDYLIKHSCIDCGESDPIVLEFDHVRGTKLDCVSVMISKNFKIDIIKKEIAKCNVRCANCHKRKTAKERDYWIHRQLDSSC